MHGSAAISLAPLSRRPGHPRKRVRAPRRDVHQPCRAHLHGLTVGFKGGSLRSSHLVGGHDHCLDFGHAAVAAACTLCHNHVFPAGPDFGSAAQVPAAREHRWRHIEYLLFQCQCIPGLGVSVALTLLRDDLLRVCSGPDHAEAVLLAAFPSGRIPVVAATACVVPFLLGPAAALGRVSPWHVKLRCLDLVAGSLLGV